MNNGMMWFDDNKGRSLEQKIRMAANYFEIKYKLKPEIVMISSKEANQDEALPSIPGLEVQNKDIVLKHHFWVGLN